MFLSAIEHSEIVNKDCNATFLSNGLHRCVTAGGHDIGVARLDARKL